MIQVKEFTFNHFQTNCYVLWDEATRNCAIVDPGMESDYEITQLDHYIEENQFIPSLILLTHAHTDHVAGLPYVCKKYNLPVTTHADSRTLLRQAAGYGSVLGFKVPQMDNLPSNYIADNTILLLGETKIESRAVPGHAQGSMVYVLPEEQMVLTGDALFHLSIGRTDLPGGDYDLLIEKLKTRILTLDGNFTILPGHGDCSSIAEELRCNPFIN